VIVAPSCALTSSPMHGMPRARKRVAHARSETMKHGTQLMSDTPASRQACAYASVARWAPTGM
jgi:hypothetical protein